MNKLQGVAKTLYLPLAARIYVSKRFPDYFYDEKALSLEKDLPYEEIVKQSGEYFEMAGACRFRELDGMIRAFVKKHGSCSNVIHLGCGLETSYFRLKPRPEEAVFYEMDLPEVIQARREVLGVGDNEILIGGDLFDLAWAEGIDCARPTLITVMGVFQYFYKGQVLDFLTRVREVFPGGEIIFDAMTDRALSYANNYVKKTGNEGAQLHFSVNDSQALARQTGLTLLEQRPFFHQAREQLGRRLKLFTRIAMRMVDEGSRRGFLLHMGL